MRIPVLYSSNFNSLTWRKVDVVLRGKGDAIIFEQRGVEVPERWSDRAATILAQKYFRKAQVPQGSLKGIETPNMPSWLWPRRGDAGISTGGETSARQVFHRMSGAWTHWGWKGGYFSSEEDAINFYREVYCTLYLQVAAPNSPQWFNTGLHWAYGIEGPDNGQWAVNL
jgi:ribonucleoside-diphosphate reductase alpha chain